MSVRSTVLVFGQPRQHLPRPQLVRICQLFHHHLPRPCLKSNPKKKVKKEMQCYRCDHPIKKNACGGQNLSHVTFAMLCSICVVPSSSFLRSMVPGLANLVSPK